ncbi:DNA polymerase III subunit gamma/tau [Neiella marina]|uniref:DNA-directed DNA polymerase n=1 Tax=Neiella holothuriorum TaxID=2870530 RepID=A0ABS7EEG3_9GAMM|nr:DNA polymerase III subunit gamma/tau [Neiella holothuriorum]MBW8190196.1 DNA polymerase III subunit gamma/tau [Neiella holothuriorum]
MSYQVLARKWRPSKFSEVVGQQHVVQALTNAMETGRLHHAYLLTGTRGVGKTTLGRILAKSLNCEQGPAAEPCGECSVCVEIDEGRFVDLIEIDAASRTKVEDTREILDNVQYRPTRGQYKVYLIDEVHMLSRHSFNALLKTLEEPPPHVKFLLATTDPQKLPVTILSRCLQFNLKAMTVEQIIGQLQFVLGQEQVSFEPLAVEQIARAAEGSMRDALSLTDQAIAHGQGQLTDTQVTAMLGLIDRDYVRALVNGLLSGHAEALMEQVSIVAGFAPDYDKLLSSLQSLVHRASLAALAPSAVAPHEPERELLQRLATHWAPEQLQLAYQILLQGRRDLAFAPDGRSGLEMILLRVLMFRPMHQIDLPKHEVMVAAPTAVQQTSAPVTSVSPSLPEDKLENKPEPAASSATDTPAELAPTATPPAQTNPVQSAVNEPESTPVDEVIPSVTSEANELAEAKAEVRPDAEAPFDAQVLDAPTQPSEPTPEISTAAQPEAVSSTESALEPSGAAPISPPTPHSAPVDDGMAALLDAANQAEPDLASLEAQQDYIMAMAQDQGFSPEPPAAQEPVDTSLLANEPPPLADAQQAADASSASIGASPSPSPLSPEQPADNHLKAPASSLSAMLSARNQLRSQIKQLESQRATTTPVSASNKAKPASTEPEEPDRESVVAAQTPQQTAVPNKTAVTAAVSTDGAEDVESRLEVSQTAALVNDEPANIVAADADSAVPLPAQPDDDVASQSASNAAPQTMADDTQASSVTLQPEVSQVPGASGQGQVKSWWEQLIDTLGFDALKRQLALDCVLEPSGQGYVLQVPEKARHLATDVNLTILLERIHSYVGLNTPIDIEHEASIEAETPRQAQGRRAEERQRDAEITIANDPIVKQLQQTFDAVVDEDTIKPIQ